MEEDILFALQQQPLEVQRVLGNCPVDLDRFESGVWYSECRQGVSTSKRAGQGRMVEEPCPPDTTALIAGQLSEQRDVGREEGIDMVITSGHATENDWNIAYTFRGGQFRCTGGQLYGCCVDGVKIDLKRTRSPKILSAAGNCLMGHIADRDSMALGWMHSGSVVQMTGYVVPTWFGYGGWGVHKYFINNPGRCRLLRRSLPISSPWSTSSAPATNLRLMLMAASLLKTTTPSIGSASIPGRLRMPASRETAPDSCTTRTTWPSTATRLGKPGLSPTQPRSTTSRDSPRLPSWTRTAGYAGSTRWSH